MLLERSSRIFRKKGKAAARRSGGCRERQDVQNIYDGAGRAYPESGRGPRSRPGQRRGVHAVRGDHRFVHGDSQREAQGGDRLLPAFRGIRREAVFGWEDSRRIQQERGEGQRERGVDQPGHRPPHAPAVPEGLPQRRDAEQSGDVRGSAVPSGAGGHARVRHRRLHFGYSL